MLFQSNTLFQLKVNRKSTKNATIITIDFVCTLRSDLLKRNYNVDLASLHCGRAPSDEFAMGLKRYSYATDQNGCFHPLYQSRVVKSNDLTTLLISNQNRP